MSAMPSCHDNDVDNEIPEPVSAFITRYFPFSEMDTYTQSGSTGFVKIKDGPGITFGGKPDYSWIEINGYGVPLPQILIYDQVPAQLYQYLEEMESTEAVYIMHRDRKAYTLTLFDSTITYDIATGKVRVNDYQRVADFLFIDCIV